MEARRDEGSEFAAQSLQENGTGKTTNQSFSQAAVAVNGEAEKRYCDLQEELNNGRDSLAIAVEKLAAVTAGESKLSEEVIDLYRRDYSNARFRIAAIEHQLKALTIVKSTDDETHEHEQSKSTSADDLRTEQQTQSKTLVLTKLSDLLNEPEERVDWLVEKRLPSAGFSLLVAKPKVGKSTLARNLALAVAQGKTFLNSATQQGTVIYLALEEKRSEVKKHFAEMGATGEEEIYIFAASAPVDALPQIRAVANEKTPVLIIIDPLFRLTRVKDGNDYAQVTAALEPLLVLARETKAHVLCVHHAGKADREAGDSILGSTAIFAAVDTALVMRRSARYRTLSSIQRYGEDLPETVLRFDQQTRTVSLGQDKEQEESERIGEAILVCLKAQEDDKEKGHALTQAEIDEAVEGKTTYKRKALKALFEAKHVERTGKGGKTDPFRYCLKDSCFLVPYIYTEHGNKNQKNGASIQKDEGYSCSRVSREEAEPAKNWEQEKTLWPEWEEPVDTEWKDEL